jgi:hypothetical protein
MPSLGVVYEKEDATLGARELACLGGSCEIDPEEGTPGPGNPRSPAWKAKT